MLAPRLFRNFPIFAFSFILFISLFIQTLLGFGQTKINKPSPPEKPKLIVGIVVDQMRYDYLYRYFSKYGDGGFKKLMSQGFNQRNTLYPYVPTATGPGHACIFTGSVPALDGIINNEWYNRYSKKTVYCVEDSTVKTVGSTSSAGKMSPRNLLVTTLGDQIKFSNNNQSKVIGISEKDRGSILPAGHSATSAYWLDGQSGNFITSTYYMKNLPDWVDTFNTKKLAATYLSKDWDTLLPIEQYTESDLDNVPYENPLPVDSLPMFPHLLSKNTNGFDLIRSTPFGNDLTKDFALETIKRENLGRSEQTDLLAISFSSTDYVGHSFGPNSVEVEDTYLRLDKDIEEIINYLEKNLGKEKVLIFLTADHGVAPISAYNKKQNIPAGSLNGGEFTQSINDFLTRNFNASLFEKFSNDQIYLNHEAMESQGIKKEQVFEKLKAFLLTQKGVSNLIDMDHIQNSELIQDQLERVKNGFYAKRSGDFQVYLEPNWMFGGSKGTTHGTSYHYDTHVPLLFYGWKVKQGEESTAQASVTDIAATISAWLHIEEPNGSIGKVMNIPLIP